MGTMHDLVPSRAPRFAAALAVLVIIGAGCSSDKLVSPPTTVKAVTTTTAAAPSTEAAETTVVADTTPTTETPTTETATTETASTPTTEGASSETSDTETATSDTAAATSDTGTATSDTAGSDTSATDGSGPTEIPVWQQTAVAHAAAVGMSFTLDCTPNGEPSTIWGTETYTDDSSVCTAAVHVGLITLAAGGAVQYEIAPGLDQYAGMDGNGITSESYGAWAVSFTFPKAHPAAGTFTPSIATWSANTSGGGLEVGDKVTVTCSTNGELGTVWGTGTYTSDSSICSAAVLEGLVTVADGGTVVVEVTPGKNSYTGSTANGVTSNDYGVWGSSFEFPKDQTPVPTKDATTTTIG